MRSTLVGGGDPGRHRRFSHIRIRIRIRYLSRTRIQSTFSSNATGTVLPRSPPLFFLAPAAVQRVASATVELPHDVRSGLTCPDWIRRDSSWSVTSRVPPPSRASEPVYYLCASEPLPRGSNANVGMGRRARLSLVKYRLKQANRCASYNTVSRVRCLQVEHC